MRTQMKIVFGTDFSDQAKSAFAEATFLAKATGSRLFVLHVIPGKYTADEGEPKAEAALRHPDGPRSLKRLHDDYISRTAVDAEPAIRHGNEASEILEFARAVNAEVIVIGAHGAGTLATFFGSGSITNRIVHDSDIPVLVVPARA